jgi:hypothetical protein
MISLEDPRVAEHDGYGHVTCEDDEHHCGERQVKCVPVAKRALKRLEDTHLLLDSALLVEVLDELGARFVRNPCRR